ncbi:Hypothetical protein A7982_01762 [Minicystis rosea]|nr:Hypothetical protein A7982_01762 [Minicystis rosea]
MIRDRLEDKAFPMKTAFKPHAKAFLAVEAKYAAAASAVDAAEETKRDALAAIGEADDALDAELDAYADVLSNAGLGPRLSPFKPFAKLTVSEVKALAYAKEAEAVRALVAAVAKKSPPANVTKAGAACLAKASAVEKALKAYGKPATAYQKALEQRAALLPDLQKAIKALRIHATSAYADDPATASTLFASPEAVQAPKQRRAPRKAKGEGTQKPVTNGAAPG